MPTLRKLKNSNLSFFIWFLYIDEMKKERKSSQESEGGELFGYQSQTTIFTIHLIILTFSKAFLKKTSLYIVAIMISSLFLFIKLSTETVHYTIHTYVFKRLFFFGRDNQGSFHQKLNLKRSHTYTPTRARRMVIFFLAQLSHNLCIPVLTLKNAFSNGFS